GLFRIQAGDTAAGTPVNQRFVHDPADSTSLGSNRVDAVLIDRRGDLWVATAAGLDRAVRGPAVRFSHYRPNPTAPTVLDNPRVFSLYEDVHQRLWIGSSAGATAFDSARTHLTHFIHRYWGRTRE